MYYKLSIKLFIKNPYTITMFLLFLVLNTLLYSFYIIFYIYFTFYWFYTLYLYLFKNLKLIKPKIYNFNGKTYPLFFFVEVYLKSYLTSYHNFYNFLLKYHKKPTINKINFIIKYLTNVIIKLITGFSKTIIKNSFIWSLKFKDFNSILNLKEKIQNDIIIITLSDLIFIEKKCIYKTEFNTFNFNPNKPNLIDPTLFNKYLKLPDKVFFNKINKKYEIASYADYINMNFSNYKLVSPKNLNNYHSTKIIDIYDKSDKKIFLGYNMTTQNKIKLINDTDLNLNINNSFEIKKSDIIQRITPPYIFNETSILNKKQKDYELDDMRLLAEKLKVNEFYTIFSLFIEKNYDVIELKPFGLERIKLNYKSSLIDVVLSTEKCELNKDIVGIYNNFNNFYTDIYQNLNYEGKSFLFLECLESKDANSFEQFKKIVLDFNLSFGDKNDDITLYFLINYTR